MQKWEDKRRKKFGAEKKVQIRGEKDIIGDEEKRNL